MGWSGMNGSRVVPESSPHAKRSPPIAQAAAIPLPMVKSLLGPYLVFLCSTVNGYEGTGRSLSLKLIHQLRQQVGHGKGGGAGG